MEVELTKYPAYVRCSAVMYLTRLIFRHYGALLSSDSPCSSTNVNEYTDLCPWPADLALFACISPEYPLPLIARLYGELLEYTKQYNYPCRVKPQKLLVSFCFPKQPYFLNILIDAKKLSFFILLADLVSFILW